MDTPYSEGSFTMGSMSRRKGAAGEREAAAALNDVLGTHLHRGRQYHGGPDSPDLAGDLPGLHVEVKRVERLALYPALSQAKRDAAPDQVPVVMHRTNNRPWLICFEVADLIRLLDVVDAQRAKLPVSGQLSELAGESAAGGAPVATGNYVESDNCL